LAQLVLIVIANINAAQHDPAVINGSSKGADRPSLRLGQRWTSTSSFRTEQRRADNLTGLDVSVR
jgi:hypothetical protein